MPRRPPGLPKTTQPTRPPPPAPSPRGPGRQSHVPPQPRGNFPTTTAAATASTKSTFVPEPAAKCAVVPGSQISRAVETPTANAECFAFQVGEPRSEPFREERVFIHRREV